MRGRVRRFWLPVLLLFVLPAICSAQSPNLQEQQDAAARGATLWNQIRRALVDVNHGQGYFEIVKDALIPPQSKPETLFVGTVVDLDSNEKPTLVLLSMGDSPAPEISLQITWSVKHPKLNKPLAVGMKIAFEGVIVGYTATPFMLYFDAVELSVFPKTDSTEGDCFLDRWCQKKSSAR